MRKRRRGKVVAIAVAVLLLGAGATAGLLLKQKHDRDEAARAKATRLAAERREAREREQEEREREERAQARLDAQIKAEQREIEMDPRRELEGGLRKSIVKHADELVADGLLNGPILRATCDPIGSASSSMRATNSAYDCMAVTEERADGSLRGCTYSARINYEKGSWTWQLGD